MFSSREETTSAPRSLRERAGHALGLARALITPVAEAADAPVPADPPHPHRRPLRTNPGPRRPGAGSPRPQLCATPLEGAQTRRLRPAGTQARDDAARR